MRKIGPFSDFGRVTSFAAFKALKGQRACPVDVQIYNMQYLQNKVSCRFGEFLMGRWARDCHMAFKISDA